ncbi:unnamed protein product [Cylindrotheca closterium]|uniref:Uncharacterized protein n=1 Tax=Cylindrotheca closterium TaxID=2856 RepID=A0AAD2CHS4_9STRA|nr:unnamed protein product [Cylindrotheca closterium]
MMMQVKSHVPGRHRKSNSFQLAFSPHPKHKRPQAVLKRTSILNLKNKSEWPELVGMDGVEARKRIRDEVPSVQASIVNLEEMITEEYMPGRVQIFVDDNCKVTWPPQIG